MKARLHDLTLARDGGYLLTIATRENVGPLFDELRETDIDVTVKKHRERKRRTAHLSSTPARARATSSPAMPTRSNVTIAANTPARWRSWCERRASGNF